MVLFPDRPLRLDNRRPAESTHRIVVRKELSESGALQVRELVASAPWLRADARPIDPGERLEGFPQPWPGDWLIELEIVGQPEYGRTDQTVSFVSGLTREPSVEIPVTVQLFPPVNLAGERLVLKPSGAQGVGQGSMLISVRRDLAEAALDVSAEPAEIAVRLESVGGRNYRLTADWPGNDDVALPREGSIRFRVGQESYRLPVSMEP